MADRMGCAIATPYQGRSRRTIALADVIGPDPSRPPPPRLRGCILAVIVPQPQSR
jgi:hypothetical protein